MRSPFLGEAEAVGPGGFGAGRGLGRGLDRIWEGLGHFGATAGSLWDTTGDCGVI